MPTRFLATAGHVRAISMLLMAALLFTGCGSYYQKVYKDSTVHPNPRSYFDLRDDALLELRDGRRVAGEVDAIRTDSITIDGELIHWSEVVTAGVFVLVAIGIDSQGVAEEELI
jgi:hypothetical protein